MNVLDFNREYTFSKIFELNAEVDEILADFGYSFSQEKLALPQYSGELKRLQDLRDRIEDVLPLVNLTTELARREILIAPVVVELVRQTRAKLRIEYPLKVSEQLQGILDYLLTTQINLLVIEAKRENLINGFTQLAVELIALDRWDRSEGSILFGAVTTGTIWEFGRLDREKKQIQRGLESYRVPEDIETLLRILLQILTS
ncbi:MULTISPECIES: hypothetical protein [Spirulina sp. CCY15215]|uniref:hypothetical protein n=1 Tax=Spirulina sp. CCY15215 TaxID=2767591 RepID=UPI00195125BA|nr:hypothetical protein [Spirulina major]